MTQWYAGRAWDARMQCGRSRVGTPIKNTPLVPNSTALWHGLPTLPCLRPKDPTREMRGDLWSGAWRGRETTPQRSYCPWRAGRPRHGAYTPPYRDDPRIALEPITQKKIFPNDGFLLRTWSTKVGTNRCFDTGRTDHEARTIRWLAVFGAGAAGRHRRRSGR